MTHSSRVAKNCMTHPLPRVQKLMTHPLSAPAHHPILFDQSLNLMKSFIRFIGQQLGMAASHLLCDGYYFVNIIYFMKKSRVMQFLH